MDVIDFWPIAVAIGVVWTLVVLVFDAGRRNKPAVQLWGQGAALIVAAVVVSLVMAGAIRQ